MESVDTSSPQTLFDAWAREGRGDRMEKGHWPTSRQILEKLDLQAGQWFLDIGCGNGYAVSWAASQVGFTGRAIGVDLSPDMITHARQQHGGANTDYHVGQADALPFADSTFDRIVAVESLYYCPDPLKALREIRRVLKPGGWFAMMADFYQENPYSKVWSSLMPIPMVFLSENDYERLFHEAGFVAVRRERLFNPAPVDPTGFTPGWGYETIDDVLTFRQQIGSLAVWGQNPLTT